MLRKPLSNAQNDELHFLWRGDRTTGNFSSVSGERAIILNRSPSLCVREMQDMLGSQTHHAIMIGYPRLPCILSGLQRHGSPALRRIILFVGLRCTFS